MATATVFVVAIDGVALLSSSWVSDDNCLFLFDCEIDETNSKAKSTAPA